MMTSPIKDKTPTSQPKGPKARASLLALVAASSLALAACSGGPGTQEEFVEVLQREDTFTEAEATCIADDVFETYGDDSDALDLLSGADTWADIAGEGGIEGFQSYYETLVSDCTTAGPSLDGEGSANS